MERTRPAPPPATADAELSSPPKGRRSLNTLIEEVRAPSADRTDVDGLLRGLARPLGPDQDPRERADLLLALIEDPQLAELIGSNDRTVRGAAVQALLALGYPYALEVPPEALGSSDSSQQAPQPLLSTSNGKWGFGLIMAVGVLMALATIVLTWHEREVETFVMIAMTFIAGTTFLPAILTLWGHNLGSRLVKGLGSLWLLVVGLLWLVPGLFALVSGMYIGLIPLITGATVITSAWLMNTKS